MQYKKDMGLETLNKLLKMSKFPWLLSNVLDADTKKNLLDVNTKLVVEIDDVKVIIWSGGYYACSNKFIS